MPLPQSYFLGIMLLPVLAMLIYLMPEDMNPLLWIFWASLFGFGWVGLMLSTRNKEN